MTSKQLEYRTMRLRVFEFQLYICNLDGAWLADISEALTETWEGRIVTYPDGASLSSGE